MEAALIKPIVDALLGLFKKGGDVRLKQNARAAITEAIRELLLADPNEDRVEAQIAIAKAAGLISHEVVLAETMLHKVKAHKATTKSVPRRPAAKKASGPTTGTRAGAATGTRPASTKKSSIKPAAKKSSVNSTKHSLSRSSSTKGKTRG